MTEHERTQKGKGTPCKEEVHNIEYCEGCVAVICNTCPDICSLLEMIRLGGLKEYKPNPDPYGLTYTSKDTF